MKIEKYISLLLVLSFVACKQQEDTHHAAKENFVINRLIIINDKDEILMAKEQEVWASPAFLYSERQFVKESIDSLATAYGLTITSPQLHGQFSFKYDYQPYATLRNYYVAKYVSGTIKIPEPMEKVEWIPSAKAIEMNTVTAIKQITEQIINYPKVVWGGSFLVSHEGDAHPTKQVEAFYPLFEAVSD